MRERNINTVIIGLLLLFVMFTFGCAKKKDTLVTTQIVTEFCSVERVNNEALISCPDGSTVTLPPQIINETIERIVEVPVIIEIRRAPACQSNKNPKCHKGDHSG